jgi:uncharacterized protein (TIGR02266 family)
MVSNNPSEQPPKAGIIHKDIKETSALTHIECLETAFFRISFAISAHKGLNTILEVIGRESLNCLKASRSTIFFMDPKTGILTRQFTHALNPQDEPIGLFEEMEVAQKVLQENRPFLAGGREIISLMGVPLSFKGKTMGVLSLVLIDEEYGFDEKSLQFFSSFANLASAAMEMIDLLETAQNGRNLRVVYERYVDNLLNQLQTPAEKESPRAESHAVEIQGEQEVDKEKLHEGPSKEKVAGVQKTKASKEESGPAPVYNRLVSSAEKGSQRPESHAVKIQGGQKVDKEKLHEGPSEEKVAGVQRTKASKEESGPAPVYNRLVSSAEKGGPRPESHAVKIQGGQKVDKEKLHEGPSEEKVPWVQGSIVTPKEESGIERRKDERVDAVVRVEFQEEYWGFTKDLSRGGAFILTPNPAELGDHFVLKLHIADGGEPIEVTCKVIWTNKYGKETWDMRRGMGVKFLNLQHEVKKRIETYIESRKSRTLQLEN